MRIFHIPNDCYATWHFPFLVWGWRTSYNWRATAMKLQVAVSKDAPRAWLSTSGASVKLFRVWDVQSGHTWTTERVKL